MSLLGDCIARMTEAVSIGDFVPAAIALFGILAGTGKFLSACQSRTARQVGRYVELAAAFSIAGIGVAAAQHPRDIAVMAGLIFICVLGAVVYAGRGVLKDIDE